MATKPLTPAEAFAKNTIDFSAAPEYWKGDQKPGPNGSTETGRDDELHAKVDELLRLARAQQTTTQMQSGLAELSRLNQKRK